MPIYGPEAFTAYANGDDPTDWRDTLAGNSMTAGDTFEVFTVDSDKCFGTTNNGVNFHTHYNGTGYASLGNYLITGKLRINNKLCGCGITVLSQYGSSDEYYRIRRYDSGSSVFFHANNHGAVAVTGGTTVSAFDPGAAGNVGAWINFKVEAEDTGSRTEIRAKFWKVGSSEPAWQIDFYDSSASRNTTGTFGFWGYSDTNGAYYDDVSVISLSSPEVAPGDAVATSAASVGAVEKGSIGLSPGDAVATSAASVGGISNEAVVSPGNAVATSAATLGSAGTPIALSPGNAVATSAASIVRVSTRTSVPTEVTIPYRNIDLTLFRRDDILLTLPARDIELTVSR